VSPKTAIGPSHEIFQFHVVSTAGVSPCAASLPNSTAVGIAGPGARPISTPLSSSAASFQINAGQIQAAVLLTGVELGRFAPHGLTPAVLTVVELGRLVPILEDILRWDSAQIRELFES